MHLNGSNKKPRTARASQGPRTAAITLSALTCVAIATGPARAHATDLTRFSIEELMNIEVISAAKLAQPLQDAAAAVFVITADDIRRSGATSVPEALRLAPGVEAARIDSSRWSVTIRGFSGRFANKLLVLIDGRSIYTPLFSGVHWEVQDLPLDDIERIEVIRGPGGSLWGANAVNGIINIITKHPRDTQGGLMTLTAGDEERAIAGVRYGGKLGDDAQYRVYGRFRERDGLVTPDGRDAGDDWRIGKGGFRLDWTPSTTDVVTVQGDLYEADFDQNFVTPSLAPPYAVRQLATLDASGGSLQARWEHRYSATSRMSLQAYYQYEDRSDPLYIADLDTFDLDFQHSFALGDRQEIRLGARLSAQPGSIHRYRRQHRRSQGPDHGAVQRLRAGSVGADPGTAASDRRRQVRAQRLHRLGMAAQRPGAVDAASRPSAVGRGVARRADALARRAGRADQCVYRAALALHRQPAGPGVPLRLASTRSRGTHRL
ncbi:MAG TPA: TonB-dependent receptor plug domain-containing protein [Xanthomonadaceae bacterium]|nr:TonB-dependent receptor plug domain-containing protein [Xanthomonadaceae bacterium]